MPLIERYVLRRTTQVFLLTLCAMTAALWVTLVLRELDVVTAKGQAIWVFLLMTGLGLPALVQIVTPIALLVGIIVTLNSLTSDSELPIISAAGASGKAISRPVLALGASLFVVLMAFHNVVAPASLAAFRTILAGVRADVIATLVQDGGFRELEAGLTMSFRERSADGGFRDVFISDVRDVQEARTFSARRGLLVQQAGGPFLVLQNGDLVRDDYGGGDAGVVTFETYALDLRQFGPADAVPVFKAMERSTLFLLDPPTEDQYLGRFPLRARAELHDRITAPLYALVFALVALAFLSRPRTNRQNRSLTTVSIVVLCLLFRAAGYAALSASRNVATAIPFLYAIPLSGIAFGIYANLHDTRAWFMPPVERMADTISDAARRLIGRRLTGGAETAESP